MDETINTWVAPSNARGRLSGSPKSPRRTRTPITGEATVRAESGPQGAAAALRAALDGTAVLTAGERHLLAELLDRIADGG